MPLPFTEDQRSAINADGRDVCVTAGAGSGKTGVLVERYVRLISESLTGVLPPEQRVGVDGILVVTFTDKATREMKSRIVDALTELEFTAERRQIETAYISTIHGLCSRLLQENPFEVGIDPTFTVIEGSHARRLLRQAVDELVGNAYDNGNAEVTELIGRVQALRHHGEDHLDPVASLADCIEKLLSKLRTSGRRQDEVFRHWSAGLQATSSSSEEALASVLSPLVAEIAELSAALRTVYSGLQGAASSLCDRVLASADSIGTGDNPLSTILELQKLAEAVSATGVRGPSGSPEEAKYIQCVCRLKAAIDEFAPVIRADLPDREASALACHRMLGLTAAVWHVYDGSKKALGKLDNDDLQAECVRLLEQFPDVRRRYQRKFRHIMVDEFQDTSPVQMRLIELLWEPTSSRTNPSGTRPGRPENDVTANYLFAVGDIQQSIYGFRGADPSLFADLERRFRDDRARTHVVLSTNFRARPELLHLISEVFRKPWLAGSQPFAPLLPGAKFDPPTTPCVELLLSQELIRQDYGALEPTALAYRVRHLVETEELRLGSRGGPRFGEPVQYRDCAILLRQLTDIQKYEDAFSQAGVPYYVVGGGRGYFARQEIRDLVNILTVLDTPFNDVALMAALRTPMVGADIDTLNLIVNATHSPDPTTVDEPHGDPGAPASWAQPPCSDRIPCYIAMQNLLARNAIPTEETQKLRLFVELMELLRPQTDRISVGHLLERLFTSTLYDVRLP